MKRRLLLKAIVIFPATGFSAGIKRQSSSDIHRQREMRDKFHEQKNTLQKQYKEKPEEKNNQASKADADDQSKPDD